MAQKDRDSSFIIKFFYLAFCVAILNSCTGARPKTEANSKPTGAVLTVLATTDFHGALESEETVSANGERVIMGGGAVLATYMKLLKKNVQGPVLWVDGGDLFQGSMASNRFEGAPVIRLFNQLGLHAAALGNHEFDYGPKGKKSVPRSKSDDPRGALKMRVAEAKFPFLAANVQDQNGKVPSWIRASTIVEFPGLKVGIVGAAAPDTPSTTNAMNLEGLRFLDPLPAVRKEAERLRSEEKVDAVVLVMHIGSGCGNNALDAIDDLSSCTIPDAIDLVKALPEGLVDVAVAGHTHRGTIKRVKNTVLLQSYSHGKFIAWANVPLEPKGRRPEVGGTTENCLTVLRSGTEVTCDPYRVRKLSGSVEQATFMGESISPDAEAAALLKPELEEVTALKNAPLHVRVLSPFFRKYDGESPLGNFMADLTRDASPGADIGMSSGGGLRADLPAGPLTYGALFNVIPFDNQLAVMKVSGKKLEQLVRQGIFGSHGAYVWSSNLRAKAKDCTLEELKVDGRPVRGERAYTIATSDFLATGGSGVKNVGIPETDVKIYWDADYIQRDLLAAYLKKRKGSIETSDFFNPNDLRIKRMGECKTQLSR